MINPRDFLGTEQFRDRMMFVIGIVHTSGFAESLFAHIAVGKFRRIRLAVSDRFPNGLNPKAKPAGDLLHRHGLFARIPSIEHSRSNTCSLDKELLVRGLRIWSEVDIRRGLLAHNTILAFADYDCDVQQFELSASVAKGLALPLPGG
jgi:hypothetical protein